MAQAQWEADSKDEDGCIRPSSLELTKHLYENKPYADVGNDGVKNQVLVKFHYCNSTVRAPCAHLSHHPKK